MWADHREHAGSSPAGGVGEPVAVPPVRSHDAAKRPAAVVLALLLALLAAGCEEVDQAAVPVGRPDDPISIASPSASTPAPTARIQSILPPEAPLSVPHASRVYFTSGGDLWQMPREGPPAPVVTGRDILAFGPSPDGEQVAVVFATQPETNGNSTVAIMAADGSVVLELPDPALAESQAPVRAIAWSPTGSAVAVARQDGSLTLVDIGGTVQFLAPPQPESLPDDLSWSPDGTMLAYRDPSLPGQASSLYVVSAATGERTQLVAGETDGAVLDLIWLPGRQAIAYVRSSPASIEGGGDVFVVPASGGPSQLLVSAGRFAPVAGVVNLAAAPDGRTLAMSVYIPGTDHPLFHGLWLLDTSTMDLTQVPTERGEAVTDLWWVDSRLVFRAVDESRLVHAGIYTGTEPFALYEVDPATLQVRERHRGP